jgi:hypothetical protein
MIDAPMLLPINEEKFSKDSFFEKSLAEQNIKLVIIKSPNLGSGRNQLDYRDIDKITIKPPPKNLQLLLSESNNTVEALRTPMRQLFIVPEALDSANYTTASLANGKIYDVHNLDDVSSYQLETVYFTISKEFKPTVEQKKRELTITLKPSKKS